MARKSGKSKGYKSALLHNGATQGDEQMVKVPGLSRRGGVWQFRVRVPDKLREIIGKREIVKSLGDVSHAEATRLTRIERMEADRLFAEAEVCLRTAPVTRLSESELRHLARSFFFRLENEAAEAPFRDDERDARAEEVRGDWVDMSQPIEDASLQLVAMEFADWAKLRVERQSPAFVSVCEAVQRAHMEHYRRETDRLQLRTEIRRDALFADVDKQHPPKPLLTFTDAVQRFMGDPRRLSLASKTKAIWEGRFAAWFDLLGKTRPVADIEKDEIEEAVKVLCWVPKNAAKMFPKEALRKTAEIAERDGLPVLSPKSVRLYIDVLNSLFKSLVADQILTKNPVENVYGPRIEDDEQRRPWTTTELAKFFNSAPYDAPWYPGRERSWVFWLPLLALFSGARQGELAGLMSDDLTEIGGRWFLNIRPNEIRRLKNKHSKRVVPVHPILERLGFIDFAREAPAGGLLFFDIPKTEMGPIAVVQKGMGYRIRKAISDKLVVFHSFRHNFRDAAREADLPLEVAGAIGGWKEGGRSSMSRYGKGYREQTLAEWLAKIEYPGLTLDHLVPKEPTAPPIRYRQRTRSVTVSAKGSE